MAEGAGLVSVLRSVRCVHWEFCGMQFTLGFTLITLTSLSKETKRTNPRNRISIKMAFPEEGLSFLRQPCTMWRNASRICSRQLRIQNEFLFFFKEAVKNKIKLGQLKLLTCVAWLTLV